MSRSYSESGEPVHLDTGPSGLAQTVSATLHLPALLASCQLHGPWAVGLFVLSVASLALNGFRLHRPRWIRLSWFPSGAVVLLDREGNRRRAEVLAHRRLGAGYLVLQLRAAGSEHRLALFRCTQPQPFRRLCLRLNDPSHRGTPTVPKDHRAASRSVV